MKSKYNTKKSSKVGESEFNFFYGAFPGEGKKLTSLWNTITSRPEQYDIPEQIVRTICSPIPPNQERLAALARGEDSRVSNFSSLITIRII